MSPAGGRYRAAGNIEIHDIATTHLYLMQEPFVTELAQRLEGCLRKAHAAP